MALLPSETWRFFTKLMLDPGRTGPVWSAINQSLRGAIARIAGADLVPVWLVFAVAAAVLGVWAAWVCLRAGDRTAGLLAVQFTGLLISPISWSHHWVWVLPLLLWCLFGPRQRLAAVRVLAIAWVVAHLQLRRQHPDRAAVHRPAGLPAWWQAWLGAIYPVLGVLTLVLLAVVSLRRPGTRGTVGRRSRRRIRV